MAASEEFWNKRAERYDAKTVKGPNYAKRIERVKAWLHDTAVVLDVGCASAEITLDIAPHVGQIHGIDVSAGMIELARKKASERGIHNARFSRTDPRISPRNIPDDPDLAEGSFDAVTAYSVIHLLEDVPGTLVRLHDLLKPGGKLITETPCIGDWNIGWKMLVKLAMLFGMAPQVVMLKVAELESMIADAGFEVMESKVYNPKSRLQCIMAKKQ
ncbi:MAG: class I SAM-dependent methyltransferase [Phycisphaerales bacterium]|nr:MAG: class I SAM-dependent methyltransferase [Phycisphaerales bacterium]